MSIQVLVDSVTRLAKCAGDASYTLNFNYQGEIMVKVLKTDVTVFYVANSTNLVVESTNDSKPTNFKWDRYKLINGHFVLNDNYIENMFDTLIQNASNVGTSGTGVYEGRDGTTLQFRKLNSTNAALTISYNSLEKSIDFDINSNALGLGDNIKVNSTLVTVNPNSSNIILDAFDKIMFRSVFWFISVDDGINMRSSKVSLIQNGTYCNIEESGTSDIGNTDELTFDASIAGNNVVLTASNTSHTKTFLIKNIRMSI